MLAIITGRTEWRANLQCRAVNPFYGHFYEVPAMLSLFISSTAVEPRLRRDLWSSSPFCKSTRGPESPELHIWNSYVINTSSSFFFSSNDWTLFYKWQLLCSNSDWIAFMWQQSLSKPDPCEFIDRGFIANKRWLMSLRWEVKLLISVKNLSGVGWRRGAGRGHILCENRKRLVDWMRQGQCRRRAVIKLRGQTLRPRCHLTPWLCDCRVAVSATAPSDVFVW